MVRGNSDSQKDIFSITVNQRGKYAVPIKKDETIMRRYKESKRSQRGAR